MICPFINIVFNGPLKPKMFQSMLLLFLSTCKFFIFSGQGYTEIIKVQWKVKAKPHHKKYKIIISDHIQPFYMKM